MKKLTKKELKLVSITIATWGLLFAGSGLVMNSVQKPPKIIKSKFEVTSKRVSEAKTNEIKLKDIELEINTPLSLDIKDYLDNAEEIDNQTLRSLKLDTSMINITEAGTYKYTIIFKKKKYNGSCIIKEKPLPNLELKLNNLKLSKGTSLSTDLSVYISQPLDDEVKKNIILDLSAVSTTENGTYQYTITYNNRLYTGTIEVYEPQTKVITPNSPKEDNDTENKDDNSQPETKTEKEIEKNNIEEK